MKFIFCLLLISTHAFSATSEEKKLFSIKLQFEEEAHRLKLRQEKAMLSARGQEKFSELEKALSLDFIDQSCVEWVYQGSASRVEAAAACRGVTNTACLSWVYQGSASRVQSAEACRGVVNMECLNWVYQGSASRVESANACLGVTDMECVKWVYQGSSSRVQSAQSCQDGRHHPRRPGDC